ncbi:hypothetical protein JB92DRAFT_3098512 [Gautieria morchelliformis]|nr:hypothetical protein JB92DRAFT_3098512 [Gautieria morchelliformis]
MHRHPAAHLHSCSRGCSPPIAPAAACKLPDSGLASSRGRLSPDIPNPSAPNKLVASRGVDVPACTRTHAQVKGDRALPVHIQPTDTTPLMETHSRRTVGTKSSISERRGLTLSFSLRSVQKDQNQLLSVWLCKISKSVLIELRKTMYILLPLAVLIEFHTSVPSQYFMCLLSMRLNNVPEAVHWPIKSIEWRNHDSQLVQVEPLW